jgi:hypothetical protein
MASPSHTLMLREISAAGDRERTGALDVAWGSAHASFFFKFGHPRHVVFTTADGRTLAGDDALAALVAELPDEIKVAAWRRATVTEETLNLTSDELIAWFNSDAQAASNGSGRAPLDADLLPLRPGAPPARAFGIADFPLLPLGPVLWSDGMANVVDLEAMLPLLPDCLLVLTLGGPHAAALVTNGAITDAFWMTDGQGLLGDAAGRALLNSTDGDLTAYRIDDPRMFAVLRTLLAEPVALTDAAADPDPLSPPDADPEPPAPTAERDGADESSPEATAPTFDLDFAYLGMPGRENAEPVVAVASPAPPPTVPADQAVAWSPRNSATPPSIAPAVPTDRAEDVLAAPRQSQPPSTFGRIGQRRSPLQVPVRVLLSLGTYALIWYRQSNRELQDFDPNLRARQPRSTRSSVAAWLMALLITVAGAALFASTRSSIRLPFDRQLTSAEAYFLMAALACLYLTLILPFNISAAKSNLTRIRLVQEHVGLAARERVGTRTAFLLVIPVVGRLALFGIEQRGINAIWTAAAIAQAPAIDVIVDRAPLVDVPDDAGPHAETGQGADMSLQPDPAVEASSQSTTAAEAAPTAPVEPPVSIDAPADADAPAVTTEISSADTVAEEPAELGTVFSELQAQPVWLRIAPPQPEAAEGEAPANAEVIPDEPSPEGAAETAAALAAETPDESDAVVPAPRADPVWFRVPALQPEEAAAAAAVDATSVLPLDADETNGTAVLDIADAQVTAMSIADEPAADAEPSAEPAAEEHAQPAPIPLPPIEFVQPRLDIDVDGLRRGLTEIAVKWLGVDDAASVAAAIAAARPGVDDFVYAISAIRVMEIPGHDSPIVRAMAREMHYYATEVLCAA